MTEDNLQRTLGRIEEALNTVQRVQFEDRTAAATYRTDIRREIGELRQDVTELNGSVTSVTRDVEAIKPEVAASRKWRYQAEGAGKLTKIIWVVLSTLGLGGIVAIVELFRRHGI